MNMKQKISPNFTIEDIHRIRENEYERQKDMTPYERLSDTAQRSRDFLKKKGIIFTSHPADPALEDDTFLTADEARL
jgi:hypothetical protein